MSKFTMTDGMDQNEIDRRTKNLLDLFKRNFIESKSDDFVSDALANMIVCNSVYAKIFEGYLALAEKRKIPQEMTDGFVKWVTDQLDELKIRLTEKYQKNDMR
jgi:hypothetical protein